MFIKAEWLLLEAAAILLTAVIMLADDISVTHVRFNQSSVSLSVNLLQTKRINAIRWMMDV